MEQSDQVAMAAQLMRALENGEVDVVEQLLAQGLDPNLEFPPEVVARGSVLLGHMSSWHGSRSLSHYPAFLEAVLRGNESIVRKMLEAGADPCAFVDDGGASKWSAIELACAQGETEIVRLIAHHGGHAISDERRSLLSSVGVPIAEVLAEFPQSADVQQMLLRCVVRAEADAMDRAVQKLMRAGARLDGPESEDSPLCVAATSKSPEKVQLLIDAGATVTKVAQSCAMSKACSVGDSECIRVLTKGGATVHERDIGSALSSNNEDAVLAVLENCHSTGRNHRNMLLPRRAMMSPVVEAVIKTGYAKAARFLFEVLGEDPYQKTSTGAPILRISSPEIKQIIVSLRTQKEVERVMDVVEPVEERVGRSPKSVGGPL